MLYFSIIDEKIEIEVNTTPETDRFPIDGHRIVDLGYLLKWAIDFQYEHSKICTHGKLHLTRESNDGLPSTLFFKCNVCHREYKKYTTNPKKNLQQMKPWFGEHWPVVVPMDILRSYCLY